VRAADDLLDFGDRQRVVLVAEREDDDLRVLPGTAVLVLRASKGCGRFGR
jgi:hypothetical protein